MSKTFATVLTIGWIGVAGLMIGTCYQQAHADVLRASSTTSWASAVYSVAGVAMSATPTQTRQPDGTYIIALDIPALVKPYSVGLVVTHSDGRSIAAVLPDGKPGPLVKYPANGCRADLNTDGAVGLSDVSLVFGLAASGASCP